MEQQQYIAQTRRWVETVVLGFNLCPFAHTPHRKNQIRYAVSEGRTAEVVLQDVERELRYLEQVPAGEVETTLLIVPYCLYDFLEYLDVLQDCEAMVEQQGWEGVFQVASFHPEYQFEGTGPEDAENYTNRSPYPVFHLLREERLEQALQLYPNPEEIPENNIQRMNDLGSVYLKLRLDELKRSN
jgi:hypothetical protein